MLDLTTIEAASSEKHTVSTYLILFPDENITIMVPLYILNLQPNSVKGTPVSTYLSSFIVVVLRKLCIWVNWTKSKFSMVKSAKMIGF